MNNELHVNFCVKQRITFYQSELYGRDNVKRKHTHRGGGPRGWGEGGTGEMVINMFMLR